MQVDSGDILAAIDGVLNISTYDASNEQSRYIEDTLKKNNIQFDGGEYGENYLIRGDDIPKAVEAFDLEVGDNDGENEGDGHMLINLEGNGDVSATLYFTFSEDNVTDMASWLIYK